MSYLEHLSTERAHKICQEVSRLLKKERLYRDPDITAIKIAEIVGESASTISAAIAQETGENFLALLARIRVNAACRMLRSPLYNDRPLSLVAVRAGFAARQTFHRTFTRIMGSTPNQYREQHKPENLSNQRP